MKFSLTRTDPRIAILNPDIPDIEQTGPVPGLSATNLWEFHFIHYAAATKNGCLLSSFLLFVGVYYFISIKILPRTEKLYPYWETSGSGTTSLAWTYIKYVDTVTVFAKNWNKGHWPLDDLWPHIFWGLMCDSTQGSLCPSPMKIHQSMWIQWLFCKNLKQKSLTPRDLWPHICWGHMCDSTQGSLCPSPMKIH